MFEAYIFYLYQQGTIPGLSRNRINVLNSWSTLNETIRFLHVKKETRKVEIIHQQMQGAQ